MDDEEIDAANKAFNDESQVVVNDIAYATPTLSDENEGEYSVQICTN